MDIGCTPFLLHGLVYLVQHLCILVSISVKLEMTGRYFVVAGRYLIVAGR